jgi:4-carboxymuconolactone decarboxylase
LERIPNDAGRLHSTADGSTFQDASLCALTEKNIRTDRFPMLVREQMTPQQKKAFDMMGAPPRNKVDGPFIPWLRSPELAERLVKVGEYVRFNSSLPLRLNEFVILIIARLWTSQFGWFVHHPIALQAGLDPEVAADLAAGRHPVGMQPDEAVVYEFCMQMHRNRAVDDDVYAEALSRLGEQGVIDLIGVSGYYTIVAMTLNVSQAPLPPGQKPPLQVRVGQ